MKGKQNYLNTLTGTTWEYDGEEYTIPSRVTELYVYVLAINLTLVHLLYVPNVKCVEYSSGLWGRAGIKRCRCMA